MLNRRDFLFSTAAAAAAAGCATAPTGNGTAIIDTHTHFYDPHRPQGVPWPDRNDPVLYRRVMPDEFKSLAQPLGVTGTVVVEASPWVEDNAWVLELADAEPFLIGLAGHLKPGAPGFAEDLSRFAAHPRFRGIRTGGWNIPVAPENSAFVRDLSLLASRGLSLDVLGGPDQLPKISRLASLLPGLRIVINHCAGVSIDGREPASQWVEGIQEAASHPGICMKASGLAEATGRPFHAPRDPAFYRPVLDVLWAAFGEDRLLFGSNWPVSERFAPYETVLAIVQDYFDAKGSRAAAKYFRTNAGRVYGVKV